MLLDLKDKKKRAHSKRDGSKDARMDTSEVAARGARFFKSQSPQAHELLAMIRQSQNHTTPSPTWAEVLDLLMIRRDHNPSGASGTQDRVVIRMLWNGNICIAQWFVPATKPARDTAGTYHDHTRKPHGEKTYYVEWGLLAGLEVAHSRITTGLEEPGKEHCLAHGELPCSR